MQGLNPRPKTEVSKTAKSVLANASDMDSISAFWGYQSFSLQL